MMGGGNHLFLHQKQLTALVMDPVMGDSGWLPKPHRAPPCPVLPGWGWSSPVVWDRSKLHCFLNPTCTQTLLNHSSCIVAAMARGSVGIRGVMGGYGVTGGCRV